jgi:hypothetical protein
MCLEVGRADQECNAAGATRRFCHQRFVSNQSIFDNCGAFKVLLDREGEALPQMQANHLQPTRPYSSPAPVAGCKTQPKAIYANGSIKSMAQMWVGSKICLTAC